MWLSILKTTTSPSPMSTTPAFSPGPWTTRGPVVGSVLSHRFEDLYEQCSFHIAEKMPSSVSVGSRPMRSRMRWYSSGFSPCSATSAGVIAMAFGSIPDSGGPRGRRGRARGGRATRRDRRGAMPRQQRRRMIGRRRCRAPPRPHPACAGRAGGSASPRRIGGRWGRAWRGVGVGGAGADVPVAKAVAAKALGARVVAAPTGDAPTTGTRTAGRDTAASAPPQGQPSRRLRPSSCWPCCSSGRPRSHPPSRRRTDPPPATPPPPVTAPPAAVPPPPATMPPPRRSPISSRRPSSRGRRSSSSRRRHRPRPPPRPSRRRPSCAR